MKNLILFLCFFVFSLQTALAVSFSDVSRSQMYYTEIQQLTKDGVVQGYEDNSFKPQKVINRAEFLKIAIGAKLTEDEAEVLRPALRDQDDKSVYQNCFRDVYAQWFAPYACYAKEKGWVLGYSDGTFRPENNINFGEAFAILGRIFELDVSAFEATDWYYPYQRYFDLFDLVGNIEQSMDFQLNRGEMAHLVYAVKKHLAEMSSKEIQAKIEEQKQLNEFRLEVFHLVNKERIANGKTPLVYNLQLEKTAQMHAEDMVNRDFFAHVNPDGVDVMTRVKNYKYDQRDAGENIAMEQVDPADVMNSWLNSKPHCENLLKANFTEMGVGIYPLKGGGFAWVQVFGKPCEERDNMIGCTTRADYQTRNAGKENEWASPFKWY